MNLLLDTDALIWWLADSDRLGQRARSAIADPRNVVYVSAASAWEIAIKVWLGRLDLPPDTHSWLPVELANNRFVELPVSVEHALGVERLPMHHTDPFDRLLIAQALAERLVIVTGDTKLEPYGVRIVRC